MPALLKEEIINVEQIAPGIFKMVIFSPYTAENAKPGQFVNIKCKEGLDAYLRRPISICEINRDEKTITIVFQVKGKGTKFLSEKKTGDIIDMIAPLGWGTFSLEPVESAVIVGGGIGIFPLYELSRSLKSKCSDITVILGFRNKELTVMEKEFESAASRLLIATDDGSYGVRGFTTDILEDILKEGKKDMIYACGPLPMLKKVARIAEKYGVNCEISLEERMGCGIGACLVCACKTKYGDDWEHSHVCYNGPVFNSREVIFDD